MAITIRLTVLTGAHKNRKFCFCGPTHCDVGRAPDCFVQLSGTERDRLISRHHCRLNLDPPLVHIADLGSSNGTYVNGKRVEPMPKDPADVPGADANVDVKDGDLITIGGITFQIAVVDCPHADEEWEGKPIWEPGQMAKKDCPLPC